jgi:hypothetical protein
MKDIYLKASDALELYAYLESAGVTVRGEDGPVVSDAHKFALDVIGTIYKPTGSMIQADEGEVPEMAAIDGYHANLRVIKADDFDSETLAGITINVPNNPARGWA